MYDNSVSLLFSHRIGCQPETLFYTVAKNYFTGGKKKAKQKKKSLVAHPPPLSGKRENVSKEIQPFVDEV